jgi:hypothetical protein
LKPLTVPLVEFKVEKSNVGAELDDATSGRGLKLRREASKLWPISATEFRNQLDVPLLKMGEIRYLSNAVL